MAIKVAEPEGIDTFAGTPAVEDTDPFFAPEPEPRVYDPTLDPGSPLWQPKKYFDLQPKVTIVMNRSRSDILSDSSGQKRIVVKVGINGYQIPITKGVPTRVPRDFALHLVDIGAATFFSEYEDAK